MSSQQDLELNVLVEEYLRTLLGDDMTLNQSFLDKAAEFLGTYISSDECMEGYLLMAKDYHEATEKFMDDPIEPFLPKMKESDPKE
jgi:hypothetical protein